MYLTGWEEESKDNPGEMLFRSWKGYPFKTLNELQQDNMIIQNPNKQPVLLKSEGIQRAKALKQTYFRTE